jgi:hypothetical protein
VCIRISSGLQRLGRGVLSLEETPLAGAVVSLNQHNKVLPQRDVRELLVTNGTFKPCKGRLSIGFNDPEALEMTSDNDASQGD